MLKPPLYALLIAPDVFMRQAIVTGQKDGTIREGHRDYKPGTTLMLCCHLEPWAVMADVTQVRHATLRELADGELNSSGFSTRDEALAGLRTFYPNMTLDSPVTVIRWANARGLLVDEAT